jgi:hypothetical protein
MNPYEQMAKRNQAARARAEMASHLMPREKEVLAEKLSKGMQAGDIEPWRLGRFDRDPMDALLGILPHIAEKYGLPRFETLAKSAAESGGFLGTGVSKEEVSERIRRAVEDGRLAVATLSKFDAKPQETLAAIPERIAKSYFIPRPGGETLSKSKDLDTVNLDEFEAAARRAGLWR